MKRFVPIAVALCLTILLASVAVAQGGVTSAHLSDAPDGPAMTQFPSGTSVVYAIFEYADMTGESVTVRVYDNYGSILLEETQEYTGSGTDSVETTTSEGYFPDGRYVTNLYQGEYLARTVIWEVGEPVAQPTPTPTPTASTATTVVDQVKDLAVPAAAVLLIGLVVWAIYRVLAAR